MRHSQFIRSYTPTSWLQVPRAAEGAGYTSRASENNSPRLHLNWSARLMGDQQLAGRRALEFRPKVGGTQPT